MVKQEGKIGTTRTAYLDKNKMKEEDGKLEKRKRTGKRGKRDRRDREESEER